MLQRINVRLAFLLAVLLTWAVRQVATENRPTILRPGLRMVAYVTNTAAGTVSAVDLIRLSVEATIPVGPRPSGVRAHPTRKEVWGVSTETGHVWVIEAATGQVGSSFYVGAAPYALDFSPDGSRAYVAASGSGTVAAIDCTTRQVVARAHVGRRPWVARVTPDGKTLLVPNRDDATLSILDAANLRLLATVGVAAGPEHIVVLPDSSTAFVSAAGAARSAHAFAQISVVDLRQKVLLANLPLPGAAGGLALKPDGGELYVPVPGSHGLAVVNTWTNEVADQILLGAAPTRATLSADAQWLYVSDPAGDRVIPVEIPLRRVHRPVAVGQRPGVSRLTPGEDLLLVVNEGSNDLAIIRTRTHSLITLIPMGQRPSDVAVKVF